MNNNGNINVNNTTNNNNKNNIGYKLFRIKDGKLFPLYIYANEETVMNEWLPAKVGPIAKDEKHVKSKLGDLALRPGWHLNDSVPCVFHIGVKGDNGELLQSPDTVWCEVEYSNKIDYQPLVNANGTNKQGKIIDRDCCMKDIPVDGFYRYKTNSKQTEPWIIAGAIKVNRILSNEEVDQICFEHGVKPQKRVV